MREWLIADLSVLDVHFQLWMLLVTGILLFGFCTLGHAVDSGGSCVHMLLEAPAASWPHSMPSIEAGTRERISPVLSACEAGHATSSGFLAVFLADCATVALPQIPETARIRQCSHSPTPQRGIAVQPSLARPLVHRPEMTK